MSVQSRISAFESFAINSNSIDFLESPPPPVVAASLQPAIAATKSSPSLSPPRLGRKTSLIDLKDWVVDDGAFPPRKQSSSNSIKAPKSTQQERPSSPTAFKANVPLIDLHSPSKPKPKLKPKPVNPALGSPKQVASSKTPPQLPARNTSFTGKLAVAATPGPQLNFLYPPRRQDSLTVDRMLDSHSKSSGHAQSSSISSFHSVSLSDPIATFPVERERDSNSHTNDIDSISLSGSYEEVSPTLASPATQERIEWQYATRKPPKLPERPNSTGLSSPVISPPLSTHSSVSTLNNAAPPYSPYTPRRAAPPPPPPSRSSDRSSILSTATTQSLSSHSSHSHQQIPSALSAATMLKTKRPTPVPLAARKRYERVFIKNTAQQRKALRTKESERNSSALLSTPSEVARNRRAAGWRGLSVDLIVDPEGPIQNRPDEGTVDDTATSDDRLEGRVVRLIWMKSGLDPSRLAAIWNECNTVNRGALNLDAFVKGMWRIDEELRRAQAAQSNSAQGLYRHQSTRSAVPVSVSAVPPRPPPRYKDILR